MVDVTGKAQTARRARASCRVFFGPAGAGVLADRELRERLLQTARIAGIQAAKRTGELIPLCHPLSVEGIELRLGAGATAVDVEAEVHSYERTGVEMEALTACTAAALTLYQVLAGDAETRIEGLCVLEKSGGKSGPWGRLHEPGETKA